ncbi:hypothetical protein Tco_0549371 [Tanacetum coccineum]
MEVLTEREIADKFFDKHLMVLKSKLKDDEPWYGDFVNYIVGKVGVKSMGNDFEGIITEGEIDNEYDEVIEIENDEREDEGSLT